MANLQALAAQFKVDLLMGNHAFTAPSVTRATLVADTFKAALYYTIATMNAATTLYTTTNEVTGGNYTAGGYAFTWVTPTQNNPAYTNNGGSTAYSTPAGAITISNLTASGFDCVLIYNTSAANRAVSVHTFSGQSITAGTFVLTMPSNAAGTALVQLT